MTGFEWDDDKNRINQKKHHITFEDAQNAFADPNRIIYEDTKHSTIHEKRYYCLGKVGNYVYTVRFTYREHKIRIFGAAIWRRERKIYEKRNKKK